MRSATYIVVVGSVLAVVAGSYCDDVTVACDCSSDCGYDVARVVLFWG